jgi:phosphatidate phosphatase PAH1
MDDLDLDGFDNPELLEKFMKEMMMNEMMGGGSM